jgi:outer membrane protein OmpA-like peptidoglycan-associated protein
LPAVQAPNKLETVKSFVALQIDFWFQSWVRSTYRSGHGTALPPQTAGHRMETVGAKMTRIHRLIGLTCLAAATIGAGMASAQADCTDLLDRFNAAIAARRLPEVKSIEGEIAQDAVCGGRLVDVRRRRAALQLVLAGELMRRGTMGPDVEELLVEADQSDVLWQAAKAVGDLRLTQRRFADATVAFEHALELIRNPARTPQAPAQPAIAQIFQSTAQARLLAADEESKLRKPVLVPSTRGSDGRIVGTMERNIRGFTPQSIPLPIRFETASAILSPLGEQAAKELLEALRQQAPEHVIIVGHTDERGGDAFNMTLSENRAKTVKKYLEQNGISAPIKIVAKGKSDPLKVQLPDLSQEETWALHRRVEWRRE